MQKLKAAEFELTHFFFTLGYIGTMPRFVTVKTFFFIIIHRIYADDFHNSVKTSPGSRNKLEMRTLIPSFFLHM